MNVVPRAYIGKMTHLDLDDTEAEALATLLTRTSSRTVIPSQRI